MAIQLFPDFHVMIVPGLHDSSPEHAWAARQALLRRLAEKAHNRQLAFSA